MIPSFLTPLERHKLLETVVEFRGLPSDALSALADVLVPRPYPRLPRPWLPRAGQARLPDHWYAPRLRSDPEGTWIHRPASEGTIDDARPEVTLGIVGFGEVRLLQRWKGRTYERVLGTGTLFGEQGVIVRRHGGTPDGVEPEAIDIAVGAVGRTVVLEAEVSEVDRLCRDFPVLLKALRAGFDAVVRAPELVDVLKRDRILSAARRDDLFALTEGLRIHTAADQTWLDMPGSDDPPPHFCVLLKGDVSRIDPQGRGQRSQDPVMGLTAVAKKVPYDKKVRAVGEVEYVKVPAARFDDLMRSRPHFGRAVRTAVDARDEGARMASKDLDVPDVVLVLGRYATSRLWGPLTDLTAEALATHLYDRTCVLHVIREGPAPQDVSLMLPAADPRYSATRTKLRHTWLVVGTDGGLVSMVDDRIARILAEVDGRDGKRAFDAVLVDPSGVPGDAPLELVDLEHINTIGYILDSSDASIPDRVVRSATEVVPVGLLGEDGTETRSFGRFLLREFSGRRLAEGHAADATGTTDMERSERSVGLSALVPRAAEATRHLVKHARRGLADLGQKLAEPHRVGDGTYGSKPPWPPRTVRVRLLTPVRGRLGELGTPRPPPTLKSIDADRSLTEAVFRLARGLTGRRVGVALGGGGAFGYVHAALLMALNQEEAQVPIDLLSGSSFGTVVGTYYAAGDTEFELLRAHPGFMRAAVFTGVVSTASMSFAIDLELGTLDLNDLDVTLLPTVTDGDTGLEGTIRRGTIGYGVRASGSLPPFAPTIEGARRHLDGGLAANVPVQILDDEGAGLIISSNPIPEPSPLSRTLPAAVPGLGPFLKMSNPLARANDTFRSTLTLMRAASSSQEAFAHVRYKAETHGKTMFDFSRRDEIIRDALEDPEQRLNAAVEAAAEAWRGLLRHPPARVQLVEDPFPMLLTPNIVFRAVGGQLQVTRVEVLSEVADVVRASPRIKRVDIGINVAALPARGRYRSGRQAGVRIRQLLIDFGVSPDRVVIGANRRSWGQERSVEFRVELDEPIADERFEDVRARLIEGARAALDQATPDRRLARLLAIEAARINLHDPAVLELLRTIIDIPVRLLREWPSNAGPAVYAGDEDRLAVAEGQRSIAVVGDGEVIRRPIRGASGRVVDLAWGPDRRLAAAVDGPEGAVVVWAHGSETPHSAAIPGAKTVAFAGEVLVVAADARRADGDGGVFLWRGGSPIRLDHPEATEALVSDDGRFIVTLGSDSRVGLWGVDGRHRRWLVTSRRGRLRGAFGKDGRLAVATGRHLLLWLDLESDPVLLSGHRRDVVALAWSHDNSILASAGLDGRICLWDADRGALRDILRPDPFNAPVVMAFQPHRRGLGFMTQKQFCVWSADTGLVEAMVGDLKADVRRPRLSWRRDGERVALSDGVSREVGFKETVELDHDGEPIQWASWAPRSPNADGVDQWAAFATAGGQVSVWNPTNRVVRRNIFGSSGIAVVVAWHPAGRWITVARGLRLMAFDLLSGAFGPSLQLDRPCRGMRWSQEGQLFLRYDVGWAIVRMDAQGQLSRTFVGDDAVSWIVPNATGDRLALLVPNEGAHIVVVDTVGDAVFQQGAVVKGGVNVTGASWSDDGELAVVFGGRASVWRPSSGLSTLPIDGPVRRVQYRPRHEGTLAVATIDRVVLWEGDGDVRVLAESSGDDHRVLSWSPDGERLAVADARGRVRAWIRGASVDVGVVEQIRRRPVSGLAWRPDGRRLISWGDDAPLRVNLVDPSDLLDAVGRFSVESRLSPGDWETWMRWTGSDPRDTWPIAEPDKPRTV